MHEVLRTATFKFVLSSPYISQYFQWFCHEKKSKSTGQYRWLNPAFDSNLKQPYTEIYY